MADDNPSKPGHLEPSELGTKEYWDTLYKRELVNNASDPSDRGTVWFDDSDAEAKLLQFLEGLAGGETSAATATSSGGSTAAAPALDRQSASFLDLGCGNGSLLFALREEGWRGRCLGVDYSPESVALARQIAGSGAVAGDDEVEFAEWDVLRGDHGAVLGQAQEQGWDVVHDKGTFDAVSLSNEADARGRRVSEGYKARVVRLVRPGGLFLVTSCNWTEEELEGWFGEGSAEVEGGAFVRVGRVNYPSFSFGGVKGQTISTLCFQKR
ncbi:putative s-adenosylmethionine-dependent methyltransferase [Diaporthe ampelina]|uniref:Protein-lysine N-methyltransferase EFM4 n=1 Tax=Diaporthe ampelina TaxID=1214573 RepID=A0A0G2FZ65_9PEZI|nr:putative s-adenosylmethionine-dependent methyltransferase [Diaporthe ampelina]